METANSSCSAACMQSNRLLAVAALYRRHLAADAAANGYLPFSNSCIVATDNTALRSGGFHAKRNILFCNELIAFLLLHRHVENHNHNCCCCCWQTTRSKPAADAAPGCLTAPENTACMPSLARCRPCRGPKYMHDTVAHDCSMISIVALQV